MSEKERSLNQSGMPVEKYIPSSGFDSFIDRVFMSRASKVIFSGLGVASVVSPIAALAESDKTIIDNPNVQIEAGLNGVETPDSFPTEGQITAKGGVGDLLNNANDSEPVTNFNAGVEDPKNDGGEVQYGTNVTNESNEAVVVPLIGVETEKSQEQLTIKNVADYLNEAPARTEKDIGYTDEDIKKKLIVLNDEKTDGLGLAHTQNIQGIFLGYVKSQDNNNFFLIIGTNNKEKERFVTALKVPLVPLCDAACRLKFNITQLKGSNWFAGSVSTSSTKNKEVLSSFLSSKLGHDFILDLYTDEVNAADVNENRIYGDSTVDYVTDLEKNYLFSRSLTSELYRNGIKKSKFKDPGLTIWQIRNGASVDQIMSSIVTLNTIDPVTIPVTTGIHFF